MFSICEFIFENQPLSSLESCFFSIFIFLGGSSSGSTTIKTPPTMAKGETEFDVGELRGKERRVGIRIIHNMLQYML